MDVQGTKKMDIEGNKEQRIVKRIKKDEYLRQEACGNKERWICKKTKKDEWIQGTKKVNFEGRKQRKMSGYDKEQRKSGREPHLARKGKIETRSYISKHQIHICTLTTK